METQVFDSRVRRPKRAENRKKETVPTFVVFLVALIIGVCLRMFVAETIKVQGPSMQPTLYTGDLVFINKIAPKTGNIVRNDIVVCHFEGRTENFVKRVIGLQGETISIKNGEVYINGEKLADDPHANGLRPSDMAPVIIPEGSVFVMGDNRGNSSDSCRYGPVPLREVRGKVLAVIWPFSKWKTF